MAFDINALNGVTFDLTDNPLAVVNNAPGTSIYSNGVFTTESPSGHYSSTDGGDTAYVTSVVSATYDSRPEVTMEIPTPLSLA